MVGPSPPSPPPPADLTMGASPGRERSRLSGVRPPAPLPRPACRLRLADSSIRGGVSSWRAGGRNPEAAGPPAPLVPASCASPLAGPSLSVPAFPRFFGCCARGVCRGSRFRGPCPRGPCVRGVRACRTRGGCGVVVVGRRRLAVGKVWVEVFLGAAAGRQRGAGAVAWARPRLAVGNPHPPHRHRHARPAAGP